MEIISRDRCGSFAQGAQEGAPQARQIADRFHIVQNLREAIQAQLSRAPGFCARPLLPTESEEVASVRDKHGGAEHRRLSRIANQHSRQAVNPGPTKPRNCKTNHTNSEPHKGGLVGPGP